MTDGVEMVDEEEREEEGVDGFGVGVGDVDNERW